MSSAKDQGARVPKLSPAEQSILELVGLPGLGVLLKFNREEVEHAEQRLLEDRDLELGEVRYYQGYRHAAVALREYITNVLEKAEILELMEDNDV